MYKMQMCKLVAKQNNLRHYKMIRYEFDKGCTATANLSNHAFYWPKLLQIVSPAITQLFANTLFTGCQSISNVSFPTKCLNHYQMFQSLYSLPNVILDLLRPIV